MDANRSRPNIILIITDQERYPVEYENDELKQFRETHLPYYKYIEENSINYMSHYVASTACSPSRACIYTGHYPILNNLMHTYGGGKKIDEINWLHPKNIPTIGHYFKEMGYNTFLVGKWHVSDANIYEETSGNVVDTMNDDGNRNLCAENLYLQQNKLKDFGFDKWIGPDPHGINKHDMGEYIDPLITDRTIELLENIDKSIPFLIIINYVNPHDIILENVRNMFDMPYTDGTIPYIPPSPTMDIDQISNEKPICQISYTKNYKKYFSLPIESDKYRQLYYFLQKKVYTQIGRLIDYLKQNNIYDDLKIVITSDHGEGLGTQGNIHQKWYNSYEEVIHVPFRIIGVKDTLNNIIIKKIYTPTSHIDILPTLVELCGGNIVELHEKIKQNFIHDYLPVGQNILKYVDEQIDNTVLYMSMDDVTSGKNQYSFYNRIAFASKIWDFRYNSVDKPSDLRCIIYSKNNEIYKYTEYYVYNNKNPYELADNFPVQYEFYDLTSDKLERKNTYNTLTSDQKLLLLNKMTEKINSSVFSPQNIETIRTNIKPYYNVNDNFRLPLIKQIYFFFKLLYRKGIYKESMYITSHPLKKNAKIILLFLGYSTLASLSIYCITKLYRPN